MKNDLVMSRKAQISGSVVALLLAVVLIPLVVHPVSAQTQVTCQGQAATLVHIGYEATITGTEGDDVIYVEGGWNTVSGAGGNDIICSTGHFNTLHGGPGDDELTGRGLYNVLYGDEGDDVLQTDDETGTLTGGGGRNICNETSC